MSAGEPGSRRRLGRPRETRHEAARQLANAISRRLGSMWVEGHEGKGRRTVDELAEQLIEDLLDRRFDTRLLDVRLADELAKAEADA